MTEKHDITTSDAARAMGRKGGKAKTPAKRQPAKTPGKYRPAAKGRGPARGADAPSSAARSQKSRCALGKVAIYPSYRPEWPQSPARDFQLARGFVIFRLECVQRKSPRKTCTIFVQLPGAFVMCPTLTRRTPEGLF